MLLLLIIKLVSSSDTQFDWSTEQSMVTHGHDEYIQSYFQDLNSLELNIIEEEFQESVLNESSNSAILLSNGIELSPIPKNDSNSDGSRMAFSPMPGSEMTFSPIQESEMTFTPMPGSETTFSSMPEDLISAIFSQYLDPVYPNTPYPGKNVAEKFPDIIGLCPLYGNRVPILTGPLYKHFKVNTWLISPKRSSICLRRYKISEDVLRKFYEISKKDDLSVDWGNNSLTDGTWRMDIPFGKSEQTNILEFYAQMAIVSNVLNFHVDFFFTALSLYINSMHELFQTLIEAQNFYLTHDLCLGTTKKRKWNETEISLESTDPVFEKRQRKEE